jgi:hypothetical protein
MERARNHACRNRLVVVAVDQDKRTGLAVVAVGIESSRKQLIESRFSDCGLVLDCEVSRPGGAQNLAISFSGFP